METWDAIRARRDVRRFADLPLPDAELDRILDARRRTPSSRNSQPWDFVVVTDRDQQVGLAAVWRYGEQDIARAVLGLPADRCCVYLMALGYPADAPLRPIRRPDRRPFTDVVHRGRW